MESTNRLSEQQRRVLWWLYQEVNTLEARNDRIERTMLRLGIAWRPSVDKERETSRRASLSRTIERLERRGLIRRVFGPKKLRTTRLKLTRKGRKVARALSG